MFLLSVKNTDICDPPVSVVQSLSGLQLGVSYYDENLTTAVIESLQGCDCCNFHKLNLSHDKSLFSCVSKCTVLVSSYKQLLSTSKNLQVLNLGNINDVIAFGIADGLEQSPALQTLQFSISELSINSIASLLKAVATSQLKTVQIIGCCTIAREPGESFRLITSFGDNDLLCKMFIALIQAHPNCCSLLESILLGQKLDLGKVTDSSLAISAIECIKSEGGSHVSKLILSENAELLMRSGDEVGSALKQLLILPESCTLQTLCLDHCLMPDSVCVAISSTLVTNKTLEILDLSHNKMSMYSVKNLFGSLRQNCSLKVLNLSCDKHFKTSPDVNESDVGREIEKTLKINNVLSVLHFGASTSPVLCRYIVKGIGVNRTLLKLSLQIKDAEILIKLFESLQCNTNLKELDIAGSSVRNKEVGSAIRETLKNNSYLQILDMHGCTISDEVCCLIAQGLVHNRNLTKLDLSYNRICSSGAMNLFQVLDDKVCVCNLRELDLSDNYNYPETEYLDEIGCDSFLSTNSTLETLNVSESCYFDQILGYKLLIGLKENTKLHSLDVSSSYFDTRLSKTFSDMLSCNKMLTELNIGFCQFSLWELNLAESLMRCCSLKKVIVDHKIANIIGFDSEVLKNLVEICDID